MNKIKQIYRALLKIYGKQGWWPIINNKTLLCEYGVGAPRNKEEQFEIAISCILAQGTEWYPNVVRALQQLKIGRPFMKAELEWIKQAEIECGKNSKGSKKVTKAGRLTQNTSWKNAEKAIANLNKNSLSDFKKLAEVETGKLARLIKPSGYYNQKAKRLKIFARHVVDNYNGDLERFFDKSRGKLRDELLSIHGIGPETADSIILYAAEKPVFVIDAYTKRIFSRIGISGNGSSYEELQQVFTANLPKNARLFSNYHALIVELGKSTCKSTPLCHKCPLTRNCNYYKREQQLFPL